ncbi:MAG: 3-deoxy-manno-octulosonate cytidylyltransferase [Porticoccaceae bacterium]|nr:3-deoxy-manno-octulosonate cytidylyltransferase [Porticoccaceae bacterium]
MTTAFSIVIPARYGSTRLPAKPLRDIAGKPMIQRVYEQACGAGAQRVIVATDDQRIADAVAAFGGEAMLTNADHQSGTDRLQEVASRCGFGGDDILVNVQGDEPLIPAAVIRQVAENLAAKPEAAVATLSEAITTEADFRNANVVKAVVDNSGFALYFSRAPVPWPRDHYLSGAGDSGVLPAGFVPQRHLGIYAYRVRELNDFVRWPLAPLEASECLEQLRFLWNGRRIHVAEACASVPGGVDTEEDLARVIAFVQGRQ